MSRYQTIDLTPQSVSGAIAHTIQPSQFADHNSAAKLYDQYRIRYAVVEVWYKPYPDGHAHPPPYPVASVFMGQICYIHDPDDNNSETFIDLQTRPNIQIKSVNMPEQAKGNYFKLIFKPRTQYQLYNGSLTTGYGMTVQPQWFDCKGDQIFYGYKIAHNDPTNLLSLQIKETIKVDYSHPI